MAEKVYAEFLKMEIDLDELSGAIESVLGCRYRLKPLGVKCTYPVFRGETDGVAPVFVKVGTREEWRRTYDLLNAVGDCGLFSRFLTEQPIEYRGHAVFAMEWKEVRSVLLEDMNPRQIESFVAGCVRLGETLQRGLAPSAGVVTSPEELYGEILQYVSRHPLPGLLLKGLVRIPEVERTYGSRPRAACHGDFHAKNFGFAGDDFAAVFDFDKLTEGLRCSDFVNAFVWQFSRLGLSAAVRRRLADAAHRATAHCPWPREELVIACNVLRLAFAVRRIRRHPDSAWMALDIWRRDRKIREFLRCLPEK